MKLIGIKTDSWYGEMTLGFHVDEKESIEFIEDYCDYTDAKKEFEKQQLKMLEHFK